MRMGANQGLRHPERLDQDAVIRMSSAVVLAAPVTPGDSRAS